MMDQHEGVENLYIGGDKNKEQKFSVEWPKKEDLLALKEKYISENSEKMFQELRSDYYMEDSDEIERLSRIVLSAKFMFLEMAKISPIPLVMKFSVVDNFEYQEDKKLMGVSNTDTSTCYVFVDTFWQKMAVEKEIDSEIKSMAAAVHEFAHMLYKQMAHLGIGQKVNGWEEDVTRQSYLEEDGDPYLATEPEIRARIWELKFLRKYFPESSLIEKRKGEFERGIEVRKSRRQLRS